jgi:serine/threonine protein kinase/tetratricopeptide (TPR) repeat protein
VPYEGEEDGDFPVATEESTEHDPLIGQIFAHYRISEKIGSGGMGVVYRGYDEHLDRQVAIKVLLAGAIADDSARKKFRNEAHALSKLNHPNIATIHDFDTQRGRDLLVMELIDGVTLNDKLMEGSLPEKEVIAFGVQLADGLSAAHDRAVIHRDLKPANLRITSDGRVKILDFGLAKLLLSARGHAGSETFSESAVMAGTLAYMAPEQLLGGVVDVRTDIHAAGAVLYQMATGLPPFASAERSELMNEVLRSSPSAATIRNPRLSPELARIIAKCLERDPENRYQSAREVAIDLRRLQAGKPLASASRRALIPRFLSTSHKQKLIVATAFLLVLLGAGVISRYFIPVSVISGPISPQLPSEKQLAVLPFTVTDADSNKSAFGAGLTETLTARLTQLTRDPHLQVVPAPEVRQKHVDSLDAARQEFGVNLVLEGNLHTFGKQVRINFILVDTRTRRQLRANSLTVVDGDAFRAEDAVVNAAFEMLGMETRLNDEDARATYGTQVAGAYDYYLQGRGYLQNYDHEENLDSAIQVFQRALELDKNYALAYAGLGEAYWQKYRLNDAAQSLQQSRSSCRTANQLDPQLPAAHACLGNLSMATGDYPNAAKEFSLVLQNEPTNDAAYKGLADAYERMGNLREAERTYRQAIALRPNYWATYNWLGVFYYHQARAHEASDMFRQVVALAPDSIRGYYNLAASLMDEGLYDDAIGAAQRSIEIHPSDYGYSNLGSAYFFERRYNEAVHAYEQASVQSPNDPLVWWNLGDGYYWASDRRSDSVAAYQRCIELATQAIHENPKDSETVGILAVCQAMRGQQDPANASIKRALLLAPDDPSLIFQAALIHMQFDKREEALGLLAKCRAAGYPRARIRDYPNFQSLHSDPQFQELLGPQ